MRRYDLSPLLRSTVGFDRFDQLFDTAMRSAQGNTFPPYNIVKSGEDVYRVSIAVAGFAEDELDVTVQDHSLLIEGKHRQDADDVTYLHRDIAGRAFQRRFELADDIKVSDAKLENGLLHIDLKREVPEHMKPRKIEIAPAQAA